MIFIFWKECYLSQDAHHSHRKRVESDMFVKEGEGARGGLKITLMMPSVGIEHSYSCITPLS